MSTDICMYYYRGVCRYGNRCWYSHDPRAFRRSASTRLRLLPEISIENIEETQVQNAAFDNTRRYQQRNIIHSDNHQVQQRTHINDFEQIPENSLGNNTTSVNQTILIKSHNDNKNQSPMPIQKLRGIRDKEGSLCDEFIKRSIESDFQCNICYEIFIKPMVLKCSHTFCETCLYFWTRRVNRCPTCRKYIVAQSYCLNLNSFIEKLVEFLPDDIKKRREKAIHERNESREKDIAEQERVRIYNANNYADDGSIQLGDYDSNDDFNDDNIDNNIHLREAQIFNMNLHDTVVHTRGVNPLLGYTVRNRRLDIITERLVNILNRH